MATKCSGDFLHLLRGHVARQNGIFDVSVIVINS